MSAITPQTEIRLLKCPIESDNRNQLMFYDETVQYNYFNSLPSIVADGCTYLRADSVIRFPDHIDNILPYNYVMYQNEGYTNKWFYAFITKMDYINDNMTAIHIKQDSYQTWQFDMVWKDSFVEREHVSVANDTLGANTVPEGLELGEYVVNSHLADSYNNDLCIVVGASEDYLNSYNMGVNVYSGVPAPLFYYRYNPDEMAAFTSMLQALASDGKTDAIVSMFLCPKWLAPRTGTTKKVDTTSSAQNETLGITRISTLNGYTPKNKKLLTYPYCYIALSNVNGQYQIYHQELWQLGTSNEMKLKMYGALTSGCSIRAVPQNYNGSTDAWDDAITAGKFPALAWPNDVYTNWLTQNGVNLFGITTLNAKTSGILQGGLQGAGGALTGDYGMVGSGLNQVWNTMQESYRMDMVPTGVKGSLNTGDVLTSTGANRIHAYRVTIKQEFARIIDDFFSMYGYKINRVKIPNTNTRSNWNYVKTIGANIEGDIPEEYLNEIKAMFNSGVTLWHTSQYYLDYSRTNS